MAACSWQRAGSARAKRRFSLHGCLLLPARVWNEIQKLLPISFPRSEPCFLAGAGRAPAPGSGLRARIDAAWAGFTSIVELTQSSVQGKDSEGRAGCL